MIEQLRAPCPLPLKQLLNEIEKKSELEDFSRPEAVAGKLQLGETYMTAPQPARNHDVACGSSPGRPHAIMPSASRVLFCPSPSAVLAAYAAPERNEASRPVGQPCVTHGVALTFHCGGKSPGHAQRTLSPRARASVYGTHGCTSCSVSATSTSAPRPGRGAAAWLPKHELDCSRVVRTATQGHGTRVPGRGAVLPASAGRGTPRQ